MFIDGTLVPNTEFGQMEIRGRAAEKRSAAAARVRRGLSWKAWAADLDEHLDRIYRLMWPNLMILGGGVSKSADKYVPRLTVPCLVVPALLRNDAGIIGAAIIAAEGRQSGPAGPGALTKRPSRRRSWNAPGAADRSSRPIIEGPRGPARRPANAPGVERLLYDDPPTAASAGPATARMIIGGESVDAADGATFDVVNPATGAVIATAPLGGKAEVDRAVELARRFSTIACGWPNWAAGQSAAARSPSSPPCSRSTARSWLQLEIRNVGKPITGSRGEIIGAGLVFDYYAGAANKIYGQTIPVSKPGLDLTLREPIGVVGLIAVLELPLAIDGIVVAGARPGRREHWRSSNPLSYSPLTAIRLRELALEAGIPAGVLNVVTGPGGTAGAALAGHPGVGKVVHRRDHDGAGDHEA